MDVKGGNFFEKHVEKLVLAGVAVVCAWLGVTRVLLSPNKVSYDNRTFSPGRIDNYIFLEQAQKLQAKLQMDPKPKQEPYQPRTPAFAALLSGHLEDGTDIGQRYPWLAQRFAKVTKYAVTAVDETIAAYLPFGTASPVEQRQYRIPTIGQVADVSAENFRAVVYVPTATVDLRNHYDAAKSEPADMDFVTVAAKFDVAELIDNFQRCFAGDSLPVQWRDPCLAKPVFAAVELQRQQLLDDGSWSRWQRVPRTKVEARREMFDIIEDVEKLPPGGIKVRMLRYDDPLVRMELLQPEPYRIASADEQWFPPELHKEYAQYRRKAELEQRKRAKEKEREKKMRDRTGKYAGPGGGYGAYPPRGYTRPAGGRPYTGPAGGYPQRDVGRFGGYRGRGARPGRGAAGFDDEMAFQQKLGLQPRSAGGRAGARDTLSKLEQKFDEILLTRDTDLTKMTEPLVFWAHDDTVQPGKTYRYRIRLGVFNPVAGTGQVAEEDRHLSKKAILWTQWSDVTEPVEVPERLYFFPSQVQKAAKKVTVQVFRYLLGYWYGKAFFVRTGEVIGKELPYEHENGEPDATSTKEDVLVPETIDYSTGKVLVDVATASAWSGASRLTKRYYPEMLYTDDGGDLEHMPIGFNNWSRQMQEIFRQVDDAQNNIKKPLRSFADGAIRSRFGLARPTTRRGAGEEESGASEAEDEAEALRRMMGE